MRVSGTRPVERTGPKSTRSCVRVKFKGKTETLYLWRKNTSRWLMNYKIKFEVGFFSKLSRSPRTRSGRVVQRPWRFIRTNFLSKGWHGVYKRMRTTFTHVWHPNGLSWHLLSPERCVVFPFPPSSEHFRKRHYLDTTVPTYRPFVRETVTCRIWVVVDVHGWGVRTSHGGRNRLITTEAPPSTVVDQGLRKTQNESVRPPNYVHQEGWTCLTW